MIIGLFVQAKVIETSGAETCGDDVRTTCYMIFYDDDWYDIINNTLLLISILVGTLRIVFPIRIY